MQLWPVGVAPREPGFRRRPSGVYRCLARVLLEDARMDLPSSPGDRAEAGSVSGLVASSRYRRPRWAWPERSTIVSPRIAYAVTVLPARAGIGFPLSKGQRLRVIDPEGGQACGLVAVRRGDASEWLSGRLSTGDTLYSNKRRPLLEITQDDVGHHGFITTACSSEMYPRKYGVEGHPSNCLESLAHALRHVGLPESFLPTPFHIFQNVVVGEDGQLYVKAPLSKPGDAIEFEAQMDLDVALSACSAAGCPGGPITPIAFEIR